MAGLAMAGCATARARASPQPGGRVRFVVISDTHVGSPGDAERLARLLPYLERERPDFILHGGDVVNDTLAAPGQLRDAQRLLSRFPARLHVVPGNHDIGMARSPDLLRTWAAAFGPTEFAFEQAGVRFLGFNAMALARACGNRRLEESVLSFLEAQVAKCEGKRTVLLYHLPQVIVPCDGLPQMPWTQRALNRFGRFVDRVAPVACLAGHWHLGVRVPWSTCDLTVAPAISGRWNLPTGYLRCVVSGSEFAAERVMLETNGKRELPLIVRLASVTEGRAPEVVR